MPLTIAPLATLSAERAAQMFRLRHRVFRERLSWNVPSIAGEERDEFDGPRATYILSTSNTGQVAGCIRLISTTDFCMIEKVFPELLDGMPMPRAADIWEMSRFAFESDTTAGTGWGFCNEVLTLIRGAVDFATQHGISRYLLVTTIGIERLMLHQGLHCHRIGTPKRIGGVVSVALVLEVDAATERALETPRAESRRTRSSDSHRPHAPYPSPQTPMMHAALCASGRHA